MSSTTSDEIVTQQFQRFTPANEYGTGRPIREFMHTRIRTTEATIVWSTWFGDDHQSKKVGVLSWFDYNEPSNEPTQALASIKLMQAWFAFNDAIAELAANTKSHDPDSFESRMCLPVIMLDDGEVETHDFGIVDDVLYTGSNMLIQPERSRFVPVVDTKCCACNEDVNLDSLDLGGLNEGKWSLIRKDGDSKNGYVAYCKACDDAYAADTTAFLTNA